MEREVTIFLPKLGESIVSATVVQWFKKEGDKVELDESLLEVTTDKVNSDIPSTARGILKSIIALPDQEIEVGEPLAILTIVEKASELSAIDKKVSVSLITDTAESISDLSNDFLTPAVLRMAREHGISIQDLMKIAGTGEGQRVTKRDLELYIQKKESKETPCPLKRSFPEKQNDECLDRIPLVGVRKVIADAMQRSFSSIPPGVLVTEIDMTKIVQYVAQTKEYFQHQFGVKLTVTSFIAMAIAQAAKKFQLFNATLENDTITVKNFVNLGIAVSIEGGVIVPTIRDADKLSLKEMAEAVAILSDKARNQKLVPSDTQNGTITMTNFGMGGTLIGTPIIRSPETAIVGIGAITKRVMVQEDDSIAIRSMVYITLTFDHRVADGMYGCQFLHALKSELENPKIH